MKITNIKITIFSAFIISLSLFSTAYAAIPGNCKQILNGENCGAGNRIVSDGCATDAQVSTWDGICKAKVPANSYEVSCTSTPMSAGANPTCSWIGSCPVGQVFNGSACVESCSPGFISYTDSVGTKSCKRIATVIYDNLISAFKATYDYVSWLDIGPWKLVGGTGPDITFNTGKVGIGTASPASKVQVVTSDDTNPSLVTAWDGRHLVVGQDGGTAGGVGISYNNTNGYGVINALSPNIAWRNLILQSGGGNVGIKTPTPTQALDVNGTTRTTNLAITTVPNCILPQNGLKTDVSGTVSCGSVSDSDWMRVWPITPSDNIWNQNAGNVGINNPSPTQKLDVIGNALVSGNVDIGTKTTTNTLRVTSLSCLVSNKQAVVTDASGNLTCGSTDDGDWTVSGSNIYRNTGNVGIGASNPLSKLSVGGDGQTGEGIYGKATSSTGTGVHGDGATGVFGYNTSAYSSGYGVYGKSDIANSYGVYGTGTYGVRGSGTTYGVWGDGPTGVFGSGTFGVSGTNTAGGGAGVYGYSTNGSSFGVSGVNTAGTGVYGIGLGMGLDGLGGLIGVRGLSSVIGVWGESTGGFGGVYGKGGTYGTEGVSGNIGIYGHGGSIGVKGEGTTNGTYGFSSNGKGVYGQSTWGNGVYGYSSYEYGVRGDGYTGVYGDGVNYGVRGNSASGHAGYFTGKGYFSGNVGIGTTDTGGYKLRVEGSTYTSTGLYSGGQINSQGGLNISGGNSYFFNNIQMTSPWDGSTKLTLTPSGDIVADNNSRGTCTTGPLLDYNATPWMCPDEKFLAGIDIYHDDANGARFYLICCEL
jgi:hypothetical protein